MPTATIRKYTPRIIEHIPKKKINKKKIKLHTTTYIELVERRIFIRSFNQLAKNKCKILEFRNVDMATQYYNEFLNRLEKSYDVRKYEDTSCISVRHKHNGLVSDYITVINAKLGV